MKFLAKMELEEIVKSSTVIFGLAERPGILISAKNEIVKFFYKRKRISTSILKPQAKRFQKNGIKLQQLQIKAPLVKEIFYCKAISGHLVTYDMIEGEDYREICGKGDVDTLSTLPGFLNHLHELGVYFRAIHLGNLILTPSGEIALVDISDLSIRSGRLSVFRRARNLAHLIDTTEDMGYFKQYSLDKFLAEYFEVSEFSDLQCRLFMARFNRALKSQGAFSN